MEFPCSAILELVHEEVLTYALRVEDTLSVPNVMIICRACCVHCNVVFARKFARKCLRDGSGFSSCLLLHLDISGSS